MMMNKLQSIRIKNFQGHEFKELHFDPECNSLIGESEAGKTSIFRAIQWVLFNRYSTDKFTTDGESERMVELVFSHVTITKRKKGSEVFYKVCNNVYRSSTIPDNVQIDISLLNFLKQISLPFWLSDSPKQVTEELNKIVNLQSIDALFASLNKRKNRNSILLKNEMEQQKEYKEKYKRLSPIKEIRKRVGCLEALSASIDEDSFYIKSVRKIVQDYHNKKNELERYQDLDGIAFPEIPKMLETNSLSRLINDHQKTFIEIKSIQKELLEVEKTLAELKDKTCPLCGK